MVRIRFKNYWEVVSKPSIGLKVQADWNDQPQEYRKYFENWTSQSNTEIGPERGFWNHFDTLRLPHKNRTCQNLWSLAEIAGYQPSEKPEICLRCHERTLNIKKVCVTAQKMRVGPSEPACRSWFQTALSCAGKEPVWWALRVGNCSCGVPEEFNFTDRALFYNPR